MSETNTNGGEMVADFFRLLPEGFVAGVLSLMNPKEACRMAAVDTVFRSALEWDAVWEKFLPEDYEELIARAVEGDPVMSSRFETKKDVYMYLADHPVIIDGGNKSFSLDKGTGKKCYMVAASDLTIVWGDTPRYWRWTSLPESRFSEVAELINVCWLEIHGTISTQMLSPGTTYAAYFVFKSTAEAYGFENQSAEVSIGISGGESQTRAVYLDAHVGQRVNMRRPTITRRIGYFRGAIRPRAPDPQPGSGQYPGMRNDGWLEMEIGEFFNSGNDGYLEMRVTEIKGGNWKGGLIVQGIEIRPKVVN